MQYTAEQVNQGRTLVSQDSHSRLALGDLILQVAPMGSDGVRSGSTTVLADFAAEIGLAESQADQYRKVSAKIPSAVRALVTERNVTVTYGIWRFVAFGDGERLTKLREVIATTAPGGRIDKAKFVSSFESSKTGEAMAPAHRESQPIDKQLADPVARPRAIAKIASDPQAVAEVNAEADRQRAEAVAARVKAAHGSPENEASRGTGREGNALTQPLWVAELGQVSAALKRLAKQVSESDQSLTDQATIAVLNVTLDSIDQSSANLRALTNVSTSLEEIV